MRLFILFLAAVCLFGCKKPAKQESTIPENQYFPDTVKAFLGAVPATANEFQNVRFVEDLDSSLITPFRIQSTSHTIANLPLVGSQGEYNSCAGWALSYMLSYQYTKLDGYNFEASPAYIWNSLNGGNNVGINLLGAIEFLKIDGSSSTTYMPAHSLLTAKPSFEAVEDAAKHYVADYYRFKTVDIEIIKSLLHKDFPLPFIAGIDKGFISGKKESYQVIKDAFPYLGPQYIYKKKSGDYFGNHAMLVVGYDDTFHAFRVMNSWGESWASAGFVWIDYDVFKTMVTNSPDPNLFYAVPRTVYLNKILSIKATTAIANGAEINQAGEASVSRGFCWSNANNKPTVQNQFSAETSGAGTGAFSSTISNLIPDTKYWIRPYVKKSSGQYLYGNRDSFTTNSLLLVNENGSIAPSSQVFMKGVRKNFSFMNYDLSAAPGIDYSLVTTANNSNSQVSISKTHTSNNLGLTLTYNQAGDLSTNFDIMYRGKKIEAINATLNDTDSLDFYKNFLKGEWLWENYMYDGMGGIIKGETVGRSNWKAIFNLDGTYLLKPTLEPNSQGTVYTYGMSKREAGYTITTSWLGCSYSYTLIYPNTIYRVGGCGAYAYWDIIKQ